MPYYNLSGLQGSTFSLSFQAVNCGGYPVSLSGYSLRSIIKENYSASTGLTFFDSAISIPESGICNISLSASGMATLPGGVYLYSVESFTPTESDVMKLLWGHFIINPETLI